MRSPSFFATIWAAHRRLILQHAFHSFDHLHIQPIFLEHADQSNGKAYPISLLEYAEDDIFQYNFQGPLSSQSTCLGYLKSYDNQPIS
jgi:hypothetical protein